MERLARAIGPVLPATWGCDAAVCVRAAGEDVPTTPGYELTAAARHASEAGHPTAGLTLPQSARRRVYGPRRRRWEALPLSVRATIALMVFMAAAMLGSWITHQMSDDPPFRYRPCHSGSRTAAARDPRSDGSGLRRVNVTPAVLVRARSAGAMVHRRRAKPGRLRRPHHRRPPPPQPGPALPRAGHGSPSCPAGRADGASPDRDPAAGEGWRLSHLDHPSGGALYGDLRVPASNTRRWLSASWYWYRG